MNPRRPGIAAAAADRDRADEIADAWMQRLPELDRAALELVLRTVRLESILHDALEADIRQLGLTRSEFDVLTALRTSDALNGMRPVDLKTNLALSSGGVTNIVKRLHSAGLVDRVQDSADRRSSRVRLTAPGVDLADLAMTAWARRQEHLLRDVPAQVRSRAAAALKATVLALTDGRPARGQISTR